MSRDNKSTKNTGTEPLRIKQEEAPDFTRNRSPIQLSAQPAQQANHTAGFSYASAGSTTNWQSQRRADPDKNYDVIVTEPELVGWTDENGNEIKKSDYSPEEWERLSKELLDTIRATHGYKP